MFSVNDWNTNKVELNTEKVQAKELLFVCKKTEYWWITHANLEQNLSKRDVMNTCAMIVDDMTAM